MTSTRQQFGSIGALLAVAMLTATTQLSGQDVSTSALEDAARSIAAGNLDHAERELQSVLRTLHEDYRALDLLGIIRVQHTVNLRNCEKDYALSPRAPALLLPWCISGGT